VHLDADRRLAVEQWLLSTLADAERGQARDEWRAGRATMLPMGTLLCAVRMPARLVCAAAGQPEGPSPEVDAILDEVLAGPVICDTRSHHYYALIGASAGALPKWQQPVRAWRHLGVAFLGRGSYIGVPRADRVQPAAYTSYWAVPSPGIGLLCALQDVARLIAAGERALEAGDATD
jgi:hypothetical protein